MRSPLELLEGRYDHALLTTYSFNVAFFEKWVLQALWAAHVRNVVVFVDPIQLGSALGDLGHSTAGRSYDLVATDVAKAAFHPKLVLLSGSEGSRLSVSSANLTADGQLRNLEAGIGFDSSIPEHRTVIRDGAVLFRRIAASSDCAPHTVELVERATRRPAELEGSNGRYRLVHNLDEPLERWFEQSGGVRATAPYASLSAARAFAERASLSLIVDGGVFAAPGEFFYGDWEVDPRRFDRRLHGKAYWMGDAHSSDLLVGSPNLSRPALLRAAGDGNLEVAILVTGGANELSEPEGAPWAEEGLPELAASRFEAEPAPSEEGSPRSFNAWVDDDRIATTGLDDGQEIESWDGTRWLSVGHLVKGSVRIKGTPPRRLRAITDRHVSYAVVARPIVLRERARSRGSSDQSKAAGELPLDLETVKVLEGVLGELYGLSERIATRGSRAAVEPMGEDEAESESGLLAWRPRYEGDEPRIPPLYLDEWRGTGDTLLTLVGRILQTDEARSSVSEAEVAAEHIGLEEIEAASEEGDSGDGELETDEPDETTRDALNKYRGAFSDLLERGSEFVSAGAVDELATTAFVYLLNLVDELEDNTVAIEGKLEPLGIPSSMLAHRIDLLKAYEVRELDDPIALRAAGSHLAQCLLHLDRLESLERERLERLAFAWSPRILEVARGDAHPDLAPLSSDAVAFLESYAERSRWKGIVDAASDELDAIVMHDRPFPIVCGRASFRDRLASPAWALVRPFRPCRHGGCGPLWVRDCE